MIELLECWNFKESDYRIKEFVMNFQIYSPLKREWVDYTNVMIDTGYDGDLLIPQIHFDILGFSRIQDIDSGFWKAESVSGEN